MGMRPAIRRELAKLRELTHFLLTGRTCHFCGLPLDAEPPRGGKVRDGDGDGPPFTAKITIHHLDGDHGNDAPDNKALAHQRCHKRHHLVLVRGRGREIVHP